MKRTAQIYALVLVVLLAASWRQWTADEPVDLEGKVVMLQGEAKDVEQVRWISADSEATITRKEDDRGEYFWVDYTRWTEKKLPSARAKTEDTGDVEDVAPEREAKRSAFKSAQKAADLMASFSPMAARRSLQVTDDEKLEEIGLLESTSSIEIVRSGRTQKLDVGGEAYGTRDYYVRHVESGKIYLVERDLLQPLKYARTRLPDRTLIGTPKVDVVSASISKADVELALVQVNADDAEKARWAHKETPDIEAEQATTWMDRMLKLKGTRYASPDEMPDDLQARFSVSFTDRQGVSTEVAILQVGEDGDWYARSEHTRGLVKLIRSTVRGLSDDVAGGLSGG